MAHFTYRLSQEADSDLEEIFDYTVHKFGFDRAVTYVSSFNDLFNRLAGNPLLGRERAELRSGLRSMVKESHVVFYRVLKNHIRIVRVLHTSRDVVKFLPPTD